VVFECTEFGMQFDNLPSAVAVHVYAVVSIWNPHGQRMIISTYGLQSVVRRGTDVRLKLYTFGAAVGAVRIVFRGRNLAFLARAFLALALGFRFLDFGLVYLGGMFDPW